MDTKIQVGSRVVFRGEFSGDERSLADIDGYAEDKAEIGKQGTVECADSGCPEVRMDSGHVIKGWAEERYELVTETRPAVGDKVRALVEELDLRKAEVYAVIEVDRDGFVVVLDDNNDRHGLYVGEYERVQESESVYLIAGMTTEYATQEAAEKFLAEDGDNGKEYTITQVVRRVRVNRTAALETI
jgi:hypothetical protein